MITPYITFYGECKEALEFYQKVFHCETKISQSYEDYIPEDIEIIPPNLNEWILHAELEICGTVIWFADEVSKQVVKGNNIKLVVTTETKIEAEKIFERLNNEAYITLPPTETFYSSFHAGITDRYGVILFHKDKLPFIEKLQSIKSKTEEEIKYVDMFKMWKRV